MKRIHNILYFIVMSTFLVSCENHGIEAKRKGFEKVSVDDTSFKAFEQSRNYLNYPVRGAFYYLWYPTTWDVGPRENREMVRYQTWYDKEKGIVPDNSTDKDSRYHSSDPQVIAKHLEYFSRANIDMGIVSWWGQTDDNGSDSNITTLFDNHKNIVESTGQESKIKWSFYYEKEGFDDRTDSANPHISTKDQIKHDLRYIKTKFIDGYPNLYAHAKHPVDKNGEERIQPVIFVYNANDGDCQVVSKWRDAVTELKDSDDIEWHVVLKVFGNYRECDVGQATITWHQYGPSMVTHQHGHSENIEGFEGVSSFVVSPGYRKANYDDQKFLRRNSSDWEAAVKNMVDSNAIWHLITTFNEWGEGTGIEPVHNYNYYNAPGNPHDIEEPDAKLDNSTYFLDVLAACESKDKCNMNDLVDPKAEELVFLSENNFFAGELCVGSYCLQIQNDRNLVIRKNGRILGGAEAKYNELPLSTGHTPFRVFMQNDGNLCIQEESLKSNTGEKYFCFGPVEGSNPRLVVQGKELKVKTDSGNSETIGSMLRQASVESDKKSIIQWQEEPIAQRQKLVIFDFDDTLWMNGDRRDKEGNDNTETVKVGLASYAISAIQEFHKRGVKIAICSKNKNNNDSLKKALQRHLNQTGIFTDAFFETPAFLTGTPRGSDDLHCENNHNTGNEGDYDDGKAYGAKHIIDYFGVQNPNDVVFFDDASYNETDITNSERETNAGFRMKEIGFICVDKREDSVDTQEGGGVTRDKAELALGMLGFSGFPTLNDSCDDEVVSVEGSALLDGETLEENEFIETPSGQYRLYMQDDGNLVKQMKNQGDGWSTLDNTGAKGSGTSLIFMEGYLIFFKGGEMIGKSQEKDEDAQGVVLTENGVLHFVPSNRIIDLSLFQDVSVNYNSNSGGNVLSFTDWINSWPANPGIETDNFRIYHNNEWKNVICDGETVKVSATIKQEWVRTGSEKRSFYNKSEAKHFHCDEVDNTNPSECYCLEKNDARLPSKFDLKMGETFHFRTLDMERNITPGNDLTNTEVHHPKDSNGLTTSSIIGMNNNINACLKVLGQDEIHAPCNPFRAQTSCLTNSVEDVFEDFEHEQICSVVMVPTLYIPLNELNGN